MGVERAGDWEGSKEWEFMLVTISKAHVFREDRKQNRAHDTLDKPQNK